MKLSIVLLNYNKSDLTLKCLQSLYYNYEKEFTEDLFEVIVVDNASDTSEFNLLQEKVKSKEYANLKIIGNNENAGFSRGCNMGSKYAKGDFLLFLNNDTVIKDHRLSDMLRYIEEDESVDILGGMLSNSDGTEQPSVGKFYTPVNAFMLLLGLQRTGMVNGNPNKIAEVDWVKGGCMMVRKDVFENLSGFDERLFMYIEDMEFCYRARKAGYKTFFYPNINIMHLDQGSSSRSFAVINIYENLLYFYKKHRKRREYLFLKAVLKTKAYFLIFIGRLTKSKYLISTYEKALKVA